MDKLGNSTTDNEYLVTGLYLAQDPPQRWADTFYAADPEEAERAAIAEYDPDGEAELTIAAVYDRLNDAIVA